MLPPLERLFARSKPIIAVIHTGPSPGVPGSTSVACAVERAVAEARLYTELGVDGLLIENLYDCPAVSEREMGPEIAAFMTRVACSVKRHAGRTPVGVQVFSEACRTALAVALAAGCDFVRAEGWSLSARHAGEALRYRRAIGGEDIPIFADVKMDDTALASDLAAAAAYHHADALVVTGLAPGLPPEPSDLHDAADVTGLPVYVGGGLDADSLLEYLDHADGFFLGRGLKENGDWRAPVCERRVRAVIGAVEYARGQEVRQ